MSSFEVLGAWKTVYSGPKGVGCSYRDTRDDRDALRDAISHGMFRGCDLERFSLRAVRWLANRQMKITLENAIKHFNEIAAHRLNEKNRSRLEISLSSYRRELEEIAREPLVDVKNPFKEDPDDET